MFAYHRKRFLTNRVFLMASPEKALLDLLYLFSFYSNAKDMLELRINQEILIETVDVKKLNDFCMKFESHALEDRVLIFRKTYDL